MSELMNLNMVLPEPLNPPFPARASLQELGRVHFVGIGGAGMSAIATLMLKAGIPVSGSDRAETATIQALREAGARVYTPQDAANIHDIDTVVISTAIHEDNPELIAARAQNLRVLHRSEALAAAMGASQVVAVAGTHGKSTTSSMIAVMLDKLGFHPSFAVGTVIAGYGSNARLGATGEGSWFVAEADESDGSFVRYQPAIAVVTNVEPDHLDFYETPERVYEAFNRFVASMTPGGVLVTCWDDEGARALAERARNAGIEVVTYGQSTEADLRVSRITSHGSESSATLRWSFECASKHYEGEQDAQLRVPGIHNQLNAAAAFITALLAGAQPEDAATALYGFVGADRRFTLRGDVAGIKVFDDYAHHPTEVFRALETGRTVADGHNLYVVFQPHLFSRTQEFAADFAQALSKADRSYVLDIYPARELPIEGVTSELITGAGFSEVHYASDAAAAIEDIAMCAVPGDIIMTVGAGDVTALGERILHELHARYPKE
ncbi:UDP-N-acetylmuramate--L-alanine ligase [Rothia sp. HMSC064D08]|uniref:UDP-N-acetylmuramate--L-alanine ligase n=1 Tax=Rothia TaxID=32207 RepID=UPI0008A5D925|nr:MULTISPECIES: UDP-N-acetylmuramate--L-alanine ligase [Rothia]OFN05135.1 UDP-N-acetylmuramate--L-alanine ligase [Rothia sp. HMSC064D08]PLA19312.1 UDP-N-acetylmuramate--L-alanine ligase [Rothia dentocariosa]